MKNVFTKSKILRNKPHNINKLFLFLIIDCEDLKKNVIKQLFLKKLKLFCKYRLSCTDIVMHDISQSQQFYRKIFHLHESFITSEKIKTCFILIAAMVLVWRLCLIYLRYLNLVYIRSDLEVSYSEENL